MFKNNNRGKLKRGKFKKNQKVKILRNRGLNKSPSLNLKDFRELTIRIFKNYISNKIKKKVRRAQKRYQRKMGNRSLQNLWKSTKIIKNQRNKAIRKNR